MTLCPRRRRRRRQMQRRARPAPGPTFRRPPPGSASRLPRQPARPSRILRRPPRRRRVRNLPSMCRIGRARWPRTLAPRRTARARPGRSSPSAARLRHRLRRTWAAKLRTRPTKQRARQPSRPRKPRTRQPTPLAQLLAPPRTSSHRRAKASRAWGTWPCPRPSWPSLRAFSWPAFSSSPCPSLSCRSWSSRPRSLHYFLPSAP
mmetsp:Transcript_129108/g.306295  ORF Transcript_129108/g.306295 Transcript_129108/m.306295 type:complete len:204 (+) Transcript_129108:228-839(+)